MSDQVRFCAKCGEAISPERMEAVPATRFCSVCIPEIEKEYRGEFYRVVGAKKLAKQGGIKITGMDYDVEFERNAEIPLRFDEAGERRQQDE